MIQVGLLVDILVNLYIIEIKYRGMIANVQEFERNL